MVNFNDLPKLAAFNDAWRGGRWLKIDDKRAVLVSEGDPVYNVGKVLRFNGKEVQAL